MKILILECYFGGSHKNWIQGIIKNSTHEFEVLSLPSLNWKWRMHGGAITLADKIKNLNYLPDLILTTSMTDVTVLKSLLPKVYQAVPIHLYFHENQFAYYWSLNDKDENTKRKSHYHFIQYVSALSSEKVFFNSRYNQNTFLKGCEKLLNTMPDHKNLDTIKNIEKKSKVLSLGLNLEEIDLVNIKKEDKQIPLIVWNHRWEDEKNPEGFFSILRELKNLDFKFNLCLLGAHHQENQKKYGHYQNEFKKEIIWWGEVTAYNDYIKWLKKSDISIVTSYQDFFGISVLEAIYCGVVTFLPNRLAYPEHFSTNSKNYLIYKDQKDLLIKILNYKNVPITNIGKEILKYGWQEQMPIYEKTIFSY